MQLSYDIQMLILGAVLTLLGGIIGYFFRYLLDRYKYESRRNQDWEDKRLDDKLVRGASMKEMRELNYTLSAIDIEEHAALADVILRGNAGNDALNYTLGTIKIEDRAALAAVVLSGNADHAELVSPEAVAFVEEWTAADAAASVAAADTEYEQIIESEERDEAIVAAVINNEEFDEMIAGDIAVAVDLADDATSVTLADEECKKIDGNEVPVSPSEMIGGVAQAFRVLRYGLLCGLITGISTSFLLFLQSIIPFTPYDHIDLEFYSGYCFSIPLVTAVLGTLVGGILALIIDSKRILLIYVSVSALVIGTIAALIGLNLLLSWKGI
jgi:hypothetical protein